MRTNRYLEGRPTATSPVEHPGKFTSRWAIPRVEPQAESKPKKNKRQIKNIVLLFIIYVFRQTKKNLFQNKPKREYKAKYTR